nr:mitochondrial proton/calcium exchanger protein-like [Tanacetum cinerariifolium]
MVELSLSLLLKKLYVPHRHPFQTKLLELRINLYGSMMHKEGTDGGPDIMKAYKAADEEINDSSDGASSPLIIHHLS